MGVQYILRKVGRKLGMNPAKQSDRIILLDWLNEAARELYDQSDFPGSLMEAPFKVNGDQTISLPWYVGRLRAVRELTSMIAWHENQMRPRYNQFNWQDQWRNYRIRNRQALQAIVVNQSVGVVTVPFVENPPIVVTLVGPTATASSINETVTMDAVSKSTVNQFLNYTVVGKDRPSLYDVTLSDVDGNVLTIIPNTETNAEYQIVDISTFPWLPQDTSPLDNYVEILYKQTLPTLSQDGDEFPANDMDDVLVNKIFQINAEEQNKADLAVAFDAKATRTAARRQDDQNNATEDMVSLVAHPHDTTLRRIGTGLRRRYPYYGGRKF